jgi:hypothetical protein
MCGLLRKQVAAEMRPVGIQITVHCSATEQYLKGASASATTFGLRPHYSERGSVPQPVITAMPDFPWSVS